MYQITRIQIEVLSLPELFKVRDAMQIIVDLGVWEMDVDARRLVNELISKKQQTHI